MDRDTIKHCFIAFVLSWLIADAFIHYVAIPIIDKYQDIQYNRSTQLKRTV